MTCRVCGLPLNLVPPARRPHPRLPDTQLPDPTRRNGEPPLMLTPAEIKQRSDIYDALVARVKKSVVGASSPHKAAEYVANALTVHDLDLLADCAVTFARHHVEARLAKAEEAPIDRVTSRK